MEPQQPSQWAKSFVSDLVIDGERVPLDRIVRQHRASIEKLRSRGLTWKALANLLRKAGAVRVDGQPYSADHLRVAFDRSDQGTDDEEVTPGAKHRTVRQRGTPTNVSNTLSNLPNEVTTPQRQTHQSGGSQNSVQDKDVSMDELAQAAARLKNLKS